LGLHDLPPFQSVAVGVGKFGEQEHSFPLVVSPKATGAQSEGQDSVTKRFKASSESPPRPGSIAPDVRRILSDHKARANRINNAEELTAEARLTCDTVTARSAVLLARVSASDAVNSPLLNWLWREGSHVVPSPHVGPMLFKDSSAVRVDFNLPPAFHACAF